VPGAIGRVAELHGTYYHDSWGFGLFFEAKMATELAAFLGRYDPERDGFWTVSWDGLVEGSIAIDALNAPGTGVVLRWFIVSDVLRGTGVGSRLLQAAVDHCGRCGFARVTLWTFAGLDAARHLYEKAGFGLAEQRRGSQWGVEVTEQRFELRLG
jgi:GNAT superfamily N-acetyltransferase